MYIIIKLQVEEVFVFTIIYVCGMRGMFSRKGYLILDEILLVLGEN